jgi:hypothetical protein
VTDDDERGGTPEATRRQLLRTPAILPQRRQHHRWLPWMIVGLVLFSGTSILVGIVIAAEFGAIGWVIATSSLLVIAMKIFVYIREDLAMARHEAEIDWDSESG